MYVFMKEVWLYSVVCLCMLQSCTRIESDESGEQEICFRGNVQELQQVNLSESRVGLGSGNKVQLYIVEQDEEGVKLPASEDFYQMSSDADGNVNFEDGEKHIYPNNPINIYGFCQRNGRESREPFESTCNGRRGTSDGGCFIEV